MLRKLVSLDFNVVHFSGFSNRCEDVTGTSLVVILLLNFF
jgi:hypothetical protein